MNIIRILLLMIVVLATYGCGKVGPLTLPENKLDKSIITYLIFVNFKTHKISSTHKTPFQLFSPVYRPKRIASKVGKDDILSL